MRFGVIMPVYTRKATWNHVLRYAKTAEKLGFDSIWKSDHLWNPFIKEGRVPAHFMKDPYYAFEVWTVMSALATVTKKMRLGTYVLCNNFRHPSLLAKMATTLDIISKGRVNLGMGACWFREEFESFGIPWRKYQTRLEMLRESITLIKKLMSEENVSFAGKNYRLENANLEPKPVQRPNVPIWVGGRSMNSLRVVAEMGDGWIPEELTLEKFSESVKIVRQLSREFGRNGDRIIMAMGFPATSVAKKGNSVDGIEKRLKGFGEERGSISGTPEECIENIKAYHKAGVEEIEVGFTDFPSLEGLRLFSETVLSHFRDIQD